jgi:hypothetical protein
LLSKNLKIKTYRTIILPVFLYGCETWSPTFGEKCRLRDEVIGKWRKLHNEEHNDLYSSPNIVRVIKSRMRWAGNAARMGERRGTFRICGDLRERDHLEDSGVHGRIILRWIFRKWNVEYGMDRAGPGYGQVAGKCESDNEPSGFINCG